METRLVRFVMAMSLLLAVLQSAVAAEPSEVVDLGQGRIQLGHIELDTDTSSFTIPGRFISQDAIDAPMEFIAVSTGGFKSYESILELDTSAVDFNLACILIGLDESKARRPEYHFDPEETLGERVALTVSYEIDGENQSFPIERLLASYSDNGPHDWVYTGSSFLPDGSYLAEEVGTLIGVVHDPESIIQHRKGLGLGNYGEVVLNPDLVPPKGTPITVILRRL